MVTNNKFLDLLLKNLSARVKIIHINVLSICFEKMIWYQTFDK